MFKIPDNLQSSENNPRNPWDPIFSSKRRLCTNTEKNEDFPRWRWGYRFLPFKSHQKQASETSSGAKIRLRGLHHVMVSALGQVSLQIIQLALKPVRQFDTRTVFVFCFSFFFSLQYWSILGMGTAACWQAFTHPVPPDSWEDLWDPKDWWSSLLFSVSWHWGRTVQKKRLSPHHFPCLLHWSNCKDGTISWNQASLKTRRNN